MTLVSGGHHIPRCVQCAPWGTFLSAAGSMVFALLGAAGTIQVAAAASVQVTVLHDFGTVLNDGEFPVSTLTPASDGNLYGVTNGGGVIGAGSVFRLAQDGSVSIVYSFGTASYPLDDDGRSPYGDLLAHADGFLYGTTRNGGLSDQGTVFRLSLLGAYQQLYDFGSFAGDGAAPYAGLVLGADGELYGTTVRGGPYSDTREGTIYRMSTSGTYAQVYTFGASALDGAWPFAGLAVGNDGSLYGTTSFSPPRVAQEGGAGTVYRYEPDGNMSRLYEFNTTGECPTDGAAPVAAMILGADGSFYGTTESGGLYDRGSIFKLTPPGDVSVLYSFGSLANDGRQPAGRLLRLADGSLLGVTRFGGEHEANDDFGGTVFLYELDGTYTRLHSFGATPTDGQWLDGGLARGADGHFYGTTTKGGATAERPDFAGVGTVFRLVTDPAGSAPTFQSAPRVCPAPLPDSAGGSGGVSLSLLAVFTLAGLLANGGNEWRRQVVVAVGPRSHRLPSCVSLSFGAAARRRLGLQALPDPIDPW